MSPVTSTAIRVISVNDQLRTAVTRRYGGRSGRAGSVVAKIASAASSFIPCVSSHNVTHRTIRLNQFLNMSRGAGDWLRGFRFPRRPSGGVYLLRRFQLLSHEV